MNSADSTPTASTPYRVALELAGLGMATVANGASEIQADAVLRRLLALPPEPASLSIAQLTDALQPRDRDTLQQLLDLAMQGGPALDHSFRRDKNDSAGRAVHVRLRSAMLPQDDVLLIIGEDSTQLQALRRTVAENTTQDPHTGLYNRGYFDQQLRREWRISMREKADLALVLIQLDYDPEWSGPRDPETLAAHLAMQAQKIPRIMRRPADIAARHSENRLAMLLPRTNQAGALHLARRLLEQQHTDTKDETRVFQLSLGVSHLATTATALGHEVLLARALAACHAARQKQELPIECWQPSMPEAPLWE